MVPREKSSGSSDLRGSRALREDLQATAAASVVSYFLILSFFIFKMELMIPKGTVVGLNEIS